jgi:hypothetical protein
VGTEANTSPASGKNSPGFAFEEVTVTSVDQKLDGPLGPIDGGLVARELHLDGKTEDKFFAPGCGEFYTADGRDVEALALAVPTDAASGPPPAALVTMETGARPVFDAARSGDWSAASVSAEKVSKAWETYRMGEVPKLIAHKMTAELDSLARAVDGRDAARSRQTAIDVAQVRVDLQLRYRPPAEINLARLDQWAAQVHVDAAARDLGGSWARWKTPT